MKSVSYDYPDNNDDNQCLSSEGASFFLGSKIGNASCYVCNKLTEYDVHLTGSKVDSSGVILAFDGMAIFMTVLYPTVDYRDVTGSVVRGGAVRKEFGDHRTKLPI